MEGARCCETSGLNGAPYYGGPNLPAEHHPKIKADDRPRHSLQTNDDERRCFTRAAGILCLRSVWLCFAARAKPYGPLLLFTRLLMLKTMFILTTKPKELQSSVC